MSFFDDFDAALEDLDLELLDIEVEVAVNAEILAIIDGALDDLKHQRIVDTNKVTNWLLDIRNLI